MDNTETTGSDANANANTNTNEKLEFVKIIGDFTKDVLTTFPELADNLNENLRLIITAEKCDDITPETIDTVWNDCIAVYPPRFFDILYQNVDIFDVDKNADVNVTFLPDIDFRMLWEQDISDKTRETIWKYLQLVLFKMVSGTTDKVSFGDTEHLFEAIDEDTLKDKLEETIKGMEELFSSMKNTEGDEEGDSEEDKNVDFDMNDIDLSNIDMKNFSNMFDMSMNGSELPNTDELHSHLTGLMNGKLGRLAQEIAEETANELKGEINMEDTKSMDQIFQKMFKNPGKLMSLVKSIGTNLEQRIKKGDIKESELLQEASEFMTKMKDMPGLGNMNEIFKQVGLNGLGKDMKLNMGALNGMLRGAQARDRLRTKLAKKRESLNKADAKPKVFSTGEVVEKSARPTVSAVSKPRGRKKNVSNVNASITTSNDTENKPVDLTESVTENIVEGVVETESKKPKNNNNKRNKNKNKNKKK